MRRGEGTVNCYCVDDGGTLLLLELLEEGNNTKVKIGARAIPSLLNDALLDPFAAANLILALIPFRARRTALFTSFGIPSFVPLSIGALVKHSTGLGAEEEEEGEDKEVGCSRKNTSGRTCSLLAFNFFVFIGENDIEVETMGGDTTENRG